MYTTLAHPFYLNSFGYSRSNLHFYAVALSFQFLSLRRSGVEMKCTSNQQTYPYGFSTLIYEALSMCFTLYKLQSADAQPSLQTSYRRRYEVLGTLTTSRHLTMNP